jgi:MFS family permease
MFASQNTGVLGITNFTVIIYASLGLTKEMPLVMYSIYTLVGTIFSFVGAIIMDKVGRKRLLRICP